MASIANLVISLISDTGKFSSDMDRTAKQQAARFKRMEQDAAKAGKAIGVAFAVIATATTAAVIKTINVADKMRDLSIQTGISTEALSEYAHVAEQSGTSLEAITTGINKMQKSLIAARDSTSESNDIFQRLGLSVEELLALSPDEQFETIAESLSNLTNAAERTAAGQAILGKGFAQLLPAVMEGKEGIRALRGEVSRYGATVSTEFANSADIFNDNLGKMALIAKGMANQFTSALLPSLIDIQEEFIDSGKAATIARDAAKLLGDTAKGLTSIIQLLVENANILALVMGGGLGFKILTPLLFAFGPAAGAAAIAIGAIATAIYLFESSAKETQRVIESLTQTISSMTDEWIDAASATELMSKQQSITQKMIETNQRLLEVQKELDVWRQGATVGISEYHERLAELEKEESDLQKTLNDSADTLGKVGKQLKDLKNATSGLIVPVTTLGVKIKDTAAFTEKWGARQIMASKAIADGIKYVEDIEEAQAAYNEQLKEFIDVGDPIGAMVQDFAERVEFANKALAAGKITAQQYQASINALSNDLGQSAASFQKVTEESDTMKEAMLESVRILERSFQSMWQNILSGGDNVFSDLLDGFKSMIAGMIHEASTRKIAVQIEAAINGDDVDFRALGEGVAAMASQIIGAKLGGGGEGANIGSAIGGAIGSIWGPIGTAIGSVLGGLVGGLFDSSKSPVLQVSSRSNANASESDDDSRISSVFGDTFLRSRRLDAGAIAEFSNALIQFDHTIGSFLDDSQISDVSDALADWSEQIASQTLTAEQILNSRFTAMLTAFSGDIQAFVNEAEGLEDRVSRLQIGVGVEKLFADQPDIFGSRTVNDFLAVVKAFQNGVETIGDAFAEVLKILDVVVSAKRTLEDFAGSDPSKDFAALLKLQSESVVETLTRLTVGLSDAIGNFDGSPEQLTQIGDLAISVRQQELNALTLIDSVAKGLNANLDRLAKDTQATINGPRAAEDVLSEARDLISTVLQAGTPEEVAKIGAEFESLIRSLSPEDTKAFGTSTLAIIEAFKAASNTALEQAKQAVLDSGAAIRDMVDGFTAMIDPLALIAATNERAALALETIATGGVQSIDDSDQIADALSDGVADMSVQLANAIRSGFAGANVVVNVVVQDGLTTS